MPTIGQKLRGTRREKGLTIQDVAHATRIHPNMLLSIEEDDFSQFPSVAYAKSFIRKYSEHLGIDLSAAMEPLNSGLLVRIEDNELMGELRNTRPKSRFLRFRRRPKNARRRVEKPGGAPLFLNFILLALISSLGIFYFLGYNAGSIEEAKSDIAAGLNLPYAPKETGNTLASLPGASSPDTTDAAGKPEVDVVFDEALPAPAADGDDIPANPLRPRRTPRMVVADERHPSPGVSALPPAGEQSAADPPAALRPEGTNPDATRASLPPAPAAREGNAPAPAEEASGDEERSPIPIAVPIRAVPVATSE